MTATSAAMTTIAARRCRRNRPLARLSRRRAAHVGKDAGSLSRATSRQFLGFLAGHLGGAPSLKQLAKLTPADVRAFMAARRSDGIGNRSLMRGLAGARSFARFLERNGKGKVGALAAVRTPKVAEDLAEAAGGRRRQAHRPTPTCAPAKTREPWIMARDAAVLALLYGSGLRISEALGLKRKDVPRGTATPSPSPAKATRRAWCRCCRRSPN